MELSPAKCYDNALVNTGGETVWTEGSLRDLHARADKPQRVAEMFSRIAGRYDRVNRFLSAGRDRSWRRLAVRAAGPVAGRRVLDVACGTGELAREFVRAGAGRVTGLDFAQPMLDRARRKFARQPIQWVQGDAMALPFADGEFDVVSIGFGLRNLADSQAGLRECVRVLAPAGRLVVLEFAMPGHGLAGRLGRWAITRLVPRIGTLLSRDKTGAYRYLAASVQTYLTFEQLREQMFTSGLIEVRTAARRALGSVGIHVGVRP